MHKDFWFKWTPSTIIEKALSELTDKTISDSKAGIITTEQFVSVAEDIFKFIPPINN